MDAFARNMGSIRKKEKISIQELADKAKVSRSLIYKIENGETQPSLEVAVRLSKALGVSLTTLISDNEQPKAQVIHPDQQSCWKDPKTGLTRRSLLPNNNNGSEWLRIILPKNSETGLIPALINKSGYIYLLSGTAEIYLNEETIQISSGDLFLIPEEVEHNLKNIGTGICDFFVLLEELMH
jgi:transcriptional regulator with XRE-family HTH domain